MRYEIFRDMWSLEFKEYYYCENKEGFRGFQEILQVRYLKIVLKFIISNG